MNDDGRSALPVVAQRISEHWVLLNERDWRQVTSVVASNGVTTISILPSRLRRTEQARQKKLGEARAAALALQIALDRLDVADKGRAAMLARQLARWIDAPQAAPAATPVPEAKKESAE